MSQEIRSFLAFELPVQMREIVTTVSQKLRNLPMNIRWVKPSNIHLTVIFMGNVSTEIIPQLSKEVEQVCSHYGPFDIAVHGIGTFGSRKSPRVLWIGLKGDMERLSFFKKALEKRLKTFGIREEARKFNPHLTLGRFKKGPGPTELLDHVKREFGSLSSDPERLDELVLFKSDLQPGGAVYTKISSWKLSGKK